MKYPLFFVFVLLLFSLNAQAQVGLMGGYRSLSSADWETALSSAYPGDYSKMDGRSLGIDYWFRLKNRRIEFTPELTVGTFEDSDVFTRQHDFISFHFNTNVYIFDLAGDCDCPTWSKEGNFFQKGFFIQVSPGVSRMKNSFSSSDFGEVVETNQYFEIGVGAGLDIGLSDFITVTPLVKFFYSPNAKWDNATEPSFALLNVEAEGPYRQLFAGLRLGFRFDELSRF